MRISVDRQRCIGAGLCALSLPEVFEQDRDEGLVVLLDHTGGDRSSDHLAAAITNCPAQAIAIEK